MIKKIIQVKDFRCLKKWNPGSDSGEFQKLNLVFAPNGTGKSTLAALLRGVPESSDWSHGLKIKVERKNGDQPVTIDSAGDSFWDNVRVFSAEYVRTNLRFDAEDAMSGAPALMYLGERSIEHQKRHEAAQRRIETATIELDGFRKRHTREVRLYEALGTDKARTISQALGGVASRFGRGFDRRNVWRELDSGLRPLEQLDETAASDRFLIEGARLDKQDPVDGGPVSVEELRDEVVAVLSRTVTSEVIAELRDNPDWDGWVRRGVELHRGRDSCLMCESELGADRMTRLDRHFDEGYRRLQDDIDALQQRVRGMETRVKEIPQRVPSDQLITPELRLRYERETKRFDGAREDILLLLQDLIQALEHKSAEPFSALSAPEAMGAVILDPSDINGLIAEHNQRVDSFDTDRAEAAGREFHRLLHPIAEQKREHESEIGKLAESQKKLKTEIENCQAVLRETHQEELNPHFFLDRLNTDISSLLWRSGLVFDYRDQRYQVLRAGQPAHHLSEGEKTAVALLYFLQSLEERGQALENTIVIVDDPVSSLDEQLLFGVYSALQARLDPGHICRQLIVLTHNFEFLRYWVNDLRRGDTPKKRRKNATLHWMVPVEQKENDGSMTRVPVLVQQDLEGKGAKILESEYFHLFGGVARGLMEARSSASVDAHIRIANAVPNDARKLLEQFLGFKYPNQVPNFANMVKQSSLQPEQNQRLIKFLHGQSHNRPGGEMRSPFNAEAQRIITDVFVLMRETDSEHYKGMCASLGLVDPLEGA